MGLLWKHVDEGYLDWMRANHEKRIPLTEYGDDRFKPFFGSLFDVGDLIYVTQISSPKPKHYNMKNAIDFYKIYHPRNKSLISVVNLNYMFPVHCSLVEDIEYRNIEKYRSFKDITEKSRYINLMRLEMQEINKLNLIEASKRLYRLKQERPDDKVAMRCFDFKGLEAKCIEYFL